MSRAWPLLAVCVLLVAPGCVTRAPAALQHASAPPARASPPAAPSPGPPEGSEGRPRIEPPTFAPAQVLGNVVGGAEDSVAVAPDGTTYVVSPLTVWRSDDNASSFHPLGEGKCGFRHLTPVPLPVQPSFGDCAPYDDYNPGLVGGGDASLSVAPNGTVWWAGLAGSSPRVPVQFSTDKGRSWSAPFDAAEGNLSDRQWIVADAQRRVFVSWRDYGDPARCSDPTSVTCGVNGVVSMRVLENGTWGPVRKVAGDRHEGPVVSDPRSGWIYVPLSDGSLSVARSRDLGASWEIVDLPGVPALVSIFPVLGADAAGTLYLTYSADPTDPVPVARDPTGLGATIVPTNLVARARVFLVTSLDHGATWSAPRMISPASRSGIFPWVAAGAPGRVAIAWYEGTYATPSDRAPDVWHVDVAVTTTADAAAPVWQSALANESPSHVGGICLEGSACDFTGGDRSRLDFFELRLLPDGAPVLAFTADGNAALRTVEVQATRQTGGTLLCCLGRA